MSLLDQAVRTGIVPDDIEVAYMDWEKGDGRTYRGGEILGDDQAAIAKFYGALRQASVRAERVR